MRILVDAMGGDNAPEAIALGAIRAAREGRPAEQFDVSALSWESLVARATRAFEAL